MSGNQTPKGNGVNDVFGRLIAQGEELIERSNAERNTRDLIALIGKPTPRDTKMVNGHTVQEYVGPGGKMTGIQRIGMERPNLDEYAYKQLAELAARLPERMHDAMIFVYNNRLTPDERMLGVTNPFDKLSPSERHTIEQRFNRLGVPTTPELFAVVVDLRAGSPALKKRFFDVNCKPVPEELLSIALPPVKVPRPSGAS